MLGDLVRNVHISDTGYDEFLHTRLGTGVVEPGPAAAALRDIGYSGMTVLEIITDALQPAPTRIPIFAKVTPYWRGTGGPNRVRQASLRRVVSRPPAGLKRRFLRDAKHGSVLSHPVVQESARTGRRIVNMSRRRSWHEQRKSPARGRLDLFRPSSRFTTVMFVPGPKPQATSPSGLALRALARSPTSSADHRRNHAPNSTGSHSYCAIMHPGWKPTVKSDGPSFSRLRR